MAIILKKAQLVGAALATMSVAIGWFMGPIYMIGAIGLSMAMVFAYDMGYFKDTAIERVVLQNLGL